MLPDSGVLKFDFQALVARYQGAELLKRYNALLGRLKCETRKQGQAEV
jgi:hypothetical protein